MATTRLLLFLCTVLLLLSITSCKPLCPISSCQVRMVHQHGGSEEFRGMPFYKKQNPKIGESLPKQKGESKKRHNDHSKRKS